MPQLLLHFLGNSGYLTLGLALVLELIAVPIPGELMMTYAGFLVSQGRLDWPLSILAAALGSMCGISLTYWIGYRLGRPFFDRYGRFIHLGPENLEKTSRWFGKYGNNVLVFAYFVPGLRHLTGYFSGISRIPWRRFISRAYPGALFWAATFISLGRALGPKWRQFHGPIQRYLFWAFLLLIALSTLLYLFRNYRPQVERLLLQLLNRTVATFHSLWRAKAFLSIILFIFLGLSFLMIRVIQNFLATQFLHFNFVAYSLMRLIFRGSWADFLQGFSILATRPALALLIVLTIVRIWRQGRDRVLEAVFLLLVSAGSFVVEQLLQAIFFRWGAVGIPSPFAVRLFPGELSLVVIATYGFAAFLLLRHSGGLWLRSAAAPAVATLSFLAGLKRILLGRQYPGDVLAGMVFGAVWLSFAILLFEIFRVLRQDGRVAPPSPDPGEKP